MATGQERFFRADYFDVPDVYGLGLSYRVTETFTLGLDVVRVRYSQLTRRLSSAFTDDEGTVDLDSLSDSDLEAHLHALGELNGLRIKDGNELRLGGEYVLINWKVPVSLRAGVWRDPEHSLRTRLPLNENGEWATNNALVFSHRDGTQWHKTIGFGLAFERFSLDAAADFSRYSDTYSVSGVFRF